MCLKVCVHLQKACVALTWLTLVENSVQTVVELVDVPISPPGNLIACCILVSPRPVKKDTSDRNSAFPTAYLKGSPSFDQNPDGELAFGTICHWYPRHAWGEIQALDSFSNFKQKPSVPCKTCIPHKHRRPFIPKLGKYFTSGNRVKVIQYFLQRWVNRDPNGVVTWEVLQITQMFQKADNITECRTETLGKRYLIRSSKGKYFQRTTKG